MKFLSVIAFSFLFSAAQAYEVNPVVAKTPDKSPEEIEGVGVTENLSGKLDPNLKFTDETGQSVQLGQYFGHGRPVLMAMIYYSCPNLCNFQFNGLVEVFNKMKGQIGRDYDVVAVSMDHKETAEVASKKRANYLKVIKQKDAEKGVHFLVGDEHNVKTLADQFGFHFKWNPTLSQFAHAAASYIVSPEGVISRYLYGIDFSPDTLHLSLVEASQGKIGNVMDQIMLFCFQYNSHKNRYVLYAFNIMRIGAALTVVALMIFLIPLWLREKKRQALGS